MLGLLTDGEKTAAKKTKSAKAKKKMEPLSPAEVLMLAQVQYNEWGSSFGDETNSFVEVSTNLGEFSDYKPYAEYTKVLSHIDTGTLVGLAYWSGGGDGEILRDPFLIESRTTKVTMRIFEDAEGHELFRVDDSEVKIKKESNTNNAQDEREQIVAGDKAYKRRLTKTLSLIRVPAGSFMMGALPNDKEASEGERPQHKVTLTKGMLVSKYACTQELYEMVMGVNPSEFKGSTRPVEQVSWTLAVLFCNKLSVLESLEPVYDIPEGLEEAIKTGDGDKELELSEDVKWNQNANGYRLPTEAEWEYCARGGEEHLYSGSDTIDDVGWCHENSDSSETTSTVGQKKPNAFGLYDMSGNVWEWVWDSFDSRKYSPSPVTDPIPVHTSWERVLRGGSVYFSADCCRISCRFGHTSHEVDDLLSFRFVRTV